MKVKLIPADINKPMEFREIPDNDKLHGAYELLGGNLYVEIVRLGRYPGVRTFNHDQTQDVPSDGSLYMLVDEDGIRKDLGLNHRASALYGTQYHGAPIVGDALLLGQDFTEDGEYDWADYPLEV